jgi:hypothetical protein
MMDKRMSGKTGTRIEYELINKKKHFPLVFIKKCFLRVFDNNLFGKQ